MPPPPSAVAAALLLAAAVPAGGATVELPEGLSTAESAAVYERMLSGGDDGPPQIVETLCERRFGGRVCPELVGPRPLAGDASVEVRTSGRWFFVPPLPAADVPEGPRLGEPATAAPGHGSTSWMVRQSFVQDGGRLGRVWRENAEKDALVDCTVAGCQVFSLVSAPDRPGEETWLAKCWVEHADGVRGAPYGCRQVAALGAADAWLRAWMSWDEAPPVDVRETRPRFRADAACTVAVPDAAAAVADALEERPLELAARALPGSEVVAVAAPRASAVVAGVAEWPSFRLRLVEARQGGADGVRWAWSVDVADRLLVAPPGSAADARWRPADEAAREAWRRRLVEAAAAAVADACADAGGAP